MSAAVAMPTWRHTRVTASTKPRVDPQRRGRARVVMAMAGFALLYGVLGVRLALLGVEASGQAAECSPISTAPGC